MRRGGAQAFALSGPHQCLRQRGPQRQTREPAGVPLPARSHCQCARARTVARLPTRAPETGGPCDALRVRARRSVLEPLVDPLRGQIEQQTRAGSDCGRKSASFGGKFAPARSDAQCCPATLSAGNAAEAPVIRAAAHAHEVNRALAFRLAGCEAWRDAAFAAPRAGCQRPFCPEDEPIALLSSASQARCRASNAEDGVQGGRWHARRTPDTPRFDRLS
ncbi:hypothetical protein SAMN05444746_13047 [Variovorax sp. OK212]|nr:hypothetical protein SAMN05518853_13147 [Variovorax sp. OK202]SFE62246.1 hypothetical protein SAMN05444746_13047 [Variovorax sp. OK212]